jgi:hypothetical protein
LFSYNKYKTLTPILFIFFSLSLFLDFNILIIKL